LSGSEEDKGPRLHYGTVTFLPFYDECGETPTQNARSNSWGKGEKMYETLKSHITGSEGCLNCTLKCGKRAEVKEGKWQTPNSEYPEYETMVSFGHYLLNDNVEAIIHMNHLCNINGVDTISCGNALAFAMECFEKGWITKEDTGGIELDWGNMDSVRSIVKQIFMREGFGNILADGVRKASQTIGKGSEVAAMHVKGLELPGHDPRTEEGGKAWAIQYGTASRGMCHSHPHEPVILGYCYDAIGERAKEFEGVEEPFVEAGKGKIVKWAQDYGNAINTLGLCNFHSYLVPGSDPQRYLQVISAVTGWEIDFDELIEIGERVSNIQRCFNTRDGIRRKDDIIPKRLMKMPAFGPYKDRSETVIQDYDAMLDEYYNARGWDKASGIPTTEKLKALGLESFFT
jgi:aldehyde:ferredoxin oxidoreductase